MSKNKILIFTFLTLIIASRAQRRICPRWNEPVTGWFSEWDGPPGIGLRPFARMLSVGILSAQIGGRAIWTVPASFVSVMALGGVLGLIDIDLNATELGIAISLVILGLAIALERRIPTRIAIIGVGFFAVFHGYAHGAEMPDTAQPFLYAGGFC
ncbi:MAG: HupE/UreJ family protein [Anaerolineae bacterium]|nr:HupE/UreJ family protein [Anaerolineae bacterium]